MIRLAGARSPHDLLQEQQVGKPHGVWRILVVCQLLNRTHGRQVRPIADELYGAPIFARWPKPHLMATAGEAELRDLVRPLGFSEQRARHLRIMSRQYCALLAEDGEFWRGYESGDWCKGLAGCGDYAKESLDLIVYGVLDTPTTDHWLVRYRDWRLKEVK